MTLERAIEILNERKHGAPVWHSQGEKPWYISGSEPNGPLVYGGGQYDVFEPFEAIAIAEKYEREAGIIADGRGANQ